MAPIPEDEPANRLPGEDSDDDGLSSPDVNYIAGHSESSGGEDIDSEETLDGYVMLPQESGDGNYDLSAGDEGVSLTDFGCFESFSASAACGDSTTTAASGVNRLMDSLDLRDQSYLSNSHFPETSTEVDAPLSPCVWSETRLRGDGVPVEQAETIMAAMKNVMLPVCSIPSWAEAVPEAVWKEQLITRIRSVGKAKPNRDSRDTAAKS